MSVAMAMARTAWDRLRALLGDDAYDRLLPGGTGPALGADEPLLLSAPKGTFTFGSQRMRSMRNWPLSSVSDSVSACTWSRHGPLA
jgi:hypothetical protein